MKQLIKNVKLLSIFLLLLSFMGCDEEDVELPEVTAGFTYTVNQELGLVTFINISENADNYEWDFGDGNSSTEINPNKIYETGEFTVTLKSSHVSGAFDTFEDRVYINIPIPVRLPINFDEANVKYTDAVAFNSAAFEVLDNPDTSGSNASASKVGALTNSGVNWEGFYYDLDAPIDLSTDKTITMNFWSDVPVDILLKLEEGTAAAAEITVSHGGSGWEQLIFTFDSADSYNRFTLFVDGPGTTAGTFYIDDIVQVATIDVTPPTITLNGDAMMTVTEGDTFTDPGATATDDTDGDISANIVVGGDTVDVNTVGTYTITYNVSDAAGNAATEVTRVVEVQAPPTSPVTSAPIPPARDAADVISIYGETYATIAVANYDPNWGQSGHNQVNTSYDPGDGNLVLAYPNFNYQGTDFGAAGPVNASSMEFLHLDIWVASTVTDRMVKVSPINNGSGAGEFLVEVPVTPGSWNSVDLPISAFTGMSWDSVIQMKFDGQFNADGSANATPYDIYLDNIYFHKAPGPVTSPDTSAPVPPARDAADVVSIYGESYTNITVDNFDPNWGQSGHMQVNTMYNPGDGNFVLAYPNFNYQGTDFGSGGPVNASSMEFLHLDIWVASTVTDRMVKVSPINNGSGANEFLVEVPVTPGSWNSVDLPFSAFTGMTWDSVIQMKFDGQFNADGSANATPYDIYLDNIYFYKAAGGGGGNVVSIFHDDYTDITIDNWGPDWGPSSARIVDGTLNGSPAKVINMEAGKTFAGIDFAASSAFDATNYTTFYIDYKVDVLLPGQVFNVKLSNHDGGNGETSAIQYTHTPSSTDINTLAIPLADFVAASDPANLARNAIAQIVISAARADINQSVNITIDSIYFSE